MSTTDMTTTAQATSAMAGKSGGWEANSTLAKGNKRHIPKFALFQAFSPTVMVTGVYQNGTRVPGKLYLEGR